MFPDLAILEDGAARAQLEDVLARKIQWFRELEEANPQARLIHPLVARIELTEETIAALQKSAAALMGFMRRIYRAESAPAAPADLSALCQELADEMRGYPNITPGGVIQTRPFFATAMQTFQDAWRALLLAATAGQPVTAIQQFTNLRIVPGRSSGTEDSRPFATTTIHSDIWIGEPVDSVNGWAALCGDMENTVIQFFHCSPGFLAPHFRHESRYDIVYTKLKDAGVSFIPLDETVARNTLYLFDCLVPHRTCRGEGRARLSIDGRLRTGILDAPSAAGPLQMLGRDALRRQYVPLN